MNSTSSSPLALSVRALVLAALLPAVAPAAVLVNFPFNNSGDGSSGLAYTTFDSTALASATVTAGPGLDEFSVGTDSWSGTTQVLKTGPDIETTSSAANALARNWYFQFTLTPNPNSSMDIRSIEADWSRGGTSGVRGWFVRSSVDNYVTDLYANETPAGTATGLQHAAFDVSGNTGLSAATTYRFYIYTPSEFRYVDFQNVQFNSHSLPSSVPEAAAASTLWLWSGALLGLMIHRRRRQ
jgi:hypothetical protein